MPMVILDSCNGCGVCLPACPTHAIRPREGALRLEVDRDLCGEWASPAGKCRCVAVCPVEGCIVPELPFVEEAWNDHERFWRAVLT